MKRTTLTGIFALVAQLVVAGIACPDAKAAPETDCKQRLAEVNEKLAAATDLDPQLLQMLKTFRNQGASHCKAGQQTNANAAFNSVEMMLSGNRNAKAHRRDKQAAAKTSKAQLTPAYLAGTWCSSRATNNTRVLYVFGPDGSYKSAPSEFRFEFVGSGSLEEFLESLPSVTEQTPERFVVQSGPVTTSFERGRGVCQADDTPATP